MLSRLRLPALLALCCCHIACVSGAAPASTVSDTWQLSVSVEGGIAGVEQRFTLTGASDTLLAVDVVRRTETTIALASTDKRELAQSVAARATAPDIDLRSTTCRDCILFEMTMTSGRTAKSRRVRYDSQTMDASPDARLIERVISIGRNGMAQRSP